MYEPDKNFLLGTGLAYSKMKQTHHIYTPDRYLGAGITHASLLQSITSCTKNKIMIAIKVSNDQPNTHTYCIIKGYKHWKNKIPED